jgi:hypothetical protein
LGGAAILNLSLKNGGMKKYLLVAIIAVAALFLYATAKFYVGKEMDYWKRPWAYSKDVNAHLLVGKWRGNFKDPDGINKEMMLEIVVPETDSARWVKAFDLNRKPSRDLKKNFRFTGTSIVTSKLGPENYQLSGTVDGNETQKLDLYFTSEESKKKVLPNFALSKSKIAEWHGNELDFLAEFSFYKADNVLSYDTADPRHLKVVPIHMNRAD